MTIAIGSKLWMFDENRRVYAEPLKKGQLWPSGGPIWREHWRPMEVIGETRVSWIVGYAEQKKPWEIAKIPKAAFKAGACPQGWALSEAHVDELVWVKENTLRLSQEVLRCYDPRVLRAVDELLKGTKKK